MASLLSDFDAWADGKADAKGKSRQYTLSEKEKELYIPASHLTWGAHNVLLRALGYLLTLKPFDEYEVVTVSDGEMVADYENSDLIMFELIDIFTKEDYRFSAEEKKVKSTEPNKRKKVEKKLNPQRDLQVHCVKQLFEIEAFGKDKQRYWYPANWKQSNGKKSTLTPFQNKIMTMAKDHTILAKFFEKVLNIALKANAKKLVPKIKLSTYVLRVNQVIASKFPKRKGDTVFKT